MSETRVSASPLTGPPANGQTAVPNIVEQIANFIRRFVFFREEVLYDFVAAWIVTTYLTELFEYVGYLFAYTAEPQSGKSRLLEVLDLLVHNSSGLLVSPTEAVLFRTAEGQTQLFDEVDSWRNKDDLRSVLNAGFRFGGFVVRMREENSDFAPKRFPVYGPRALAGIGTRILDVTTRDRTFMLEMVRQMKGEKREQLRIRRIKSMSSYLQKRIVEWAKANKEQVKKVYDKSVFPYLDELRDRSIDITQPIATIVEVAYCGSEKLHVAQSKLVQAIRITRDEQQVGDEHHKVLRQLLQIADSNDPLVGSAGELSEMCGKLLADPPSPESITWTLRQYGFKTKSVRKGDQPRQRYVLPKAKLTEILARFGPGEMPDPQGEPSVVGSPDFEVDPSCVVGVVGRTAEEGERRTGSPETADEASPPFEPTTATTQLPKRETDLE